MRGASADITQRAVAEVDDGGAVLLGHVLNARERRRVVDLRLEPITVPSGAP